MGRLIGAVVLGYMVMFVFVFVSFSVAFIAIGTERGFKPDSYDVSDLWIALSIGLGLVAAILGGVAAAAVAKSAKGPRALAVVILILGLAMALPGLTASDKDQPEVRTGDVENMEAMQNAKQPTWMLLLNPVIGAVGALIGGTLMKSGS